MVQPCAWRFSEEVDLAAYILAFVAHSAHTLGRHNAHSCDPVSTLSGRFSWGPSHEDHKETQEELAQALNQPLHLAVSSHHTLITMQQGQQSLYSTVSGVPVAPMPFLLSLLSPVPSPGFPLGLLITRALPTWGHLWLSQLRFCPPLPGLSTLELKCDCHRRISPVSPPRSALTLQVT